jgi:DNA-binding beta-propeller fold protein YncE
MNPMYGLSLSLQLKRRWTPCVLMCVLLAFFGLVMGCGNSPAEPDLVWGKRGLQPGEFVRPRAIALGSLTPGNEELYVIDFAGRIQVFDLNGHPRREWKTPTIANGRPAGCAWSSSGKLLVADSHYQQLLVYSPEGVLLNKIPGTLGKGNLGPFGYVADVAEDTDGNLYVSEFGNEDQDRIRKLAPDGRHLLAFGGHGSQPGQFGRPRGIAISAQGELFVADSCNHRIQVFDLTGRFLRAFGQAGSGSDDMQYPYDVALGTDNAVYVAEWGNHRIHKYNTSGQSLGTWGKPGRDPGCLNQPWGLIASPKVVLFVLDSDNHRIQRLNW